jgi:hypothetical protein
VSPTPLGGEDAPRQPAPPPLFGEATPPAAHPGPATALPRKSTGGPSQARPTNPPRGRGETDHGTDRPTPLGGAARRTRTGFGGIGAKRGPSGTPRSTTGAKRGTTAQTAAPSALFGAPPEPSDAPGADRGPIGALRSTTGAKRRTRLLFGAPPPPNGTGPTPPPRQRPPRGPLERQRHRHRPDGDPLGGHQKGSGTCQGQPAPRRRPPRGPPERQRHRDELLGARRSPKHRDQRTALWKELKAQGSIERRLSGNAEPLATDFLVAQGPEVGRPAEPDQTHVATRAESPQKRQGTARGQRPW